MTAVDASTGIGAGLIGRGTLLRGMKGTAGAIGHILIPRGADVPCMCGNKGCLVALAGGPAITKSLTTAGFKAGNVDDVVELAPAPPTPATILGRF